MYLGGLERFGSSEPQGRMLWKKVHGERGNTPQQLWEKCLSRHPNLFLVLCGDQSASIAHRQESRGLAGNLVKHNASISGAEVGCQGEVGTACAMAAAAAAQLLGGSVRQIEYAAEMGLEHHLGLTCDPIGGYVQIPCIERNAIAAVRAIDCATYALLSDGQHLVSFDEVVHTMWETGRDMKSGYRETAEGGLAKVHRMARLGKPPSPFAGMGS